MPTTPERFSVLCAAFGRGGSEARRSEGPAAREHRGGRGRAASSACRASSSDGEVFWGADSVDFVSAFLRDEAVLRNPEMRACRRAADRRRAEGVSHAFAIREHRRSDQARRALRMVVVGGVPSPWGEAAAKGILHIKAIEWGRGCALSTTASRSRNGRASVAARVAIYEKEPPRAFALWPADPAQRTIR